MPTLLYNAVKKGNNDQTFSLAAKENPAAILSTRGTDHPNTQKGTLDKIAGNPGMTTMELAKHYMQEAAGKIITDPENLSEHLKQSVSYRETIEILDKTTTFLQKNKKPFNLSLFNLFNKNNHVIISSNAKAWHLWLDTFPVFKTLIDYISQQLSTTGNKPEQQTLIQDILTHRLLDPVIVKKLPDAAAQSAWLGKLITFVDDTLRNHPTPVPLKLVNIPQ